MDVSKSDDSHGERAFPSTGSKKEAVIELLVDCCLVTAGDEREGQEKERQLLHAACPILILFFFVENAKPDERIADSLSAVQVLCRLLRQLRSLRQSKPLQFIVQIASRN